MGNKLRVDGLKPLTHISFFGLLMLGVLGWLIHGNWTGYRYLMHSGTVAGRLHKLDSFLVPSAEMMDISARLAVLGDVSAQRLNHTWDDQLTNALKDFQGERNSAKMIEFTAELNKTHDALDLEENKAFALARLGRLKEAKSILGGDNYADSKRAYAAAVKQLRDAISESESAIIEIRKKSVRERILGMIALIPIVLLGWILSVRALRRWYLLDAARVAEIARNNETLEEKIKARTVELENSRRAAINMMRDAERTSKALQQSQTQLLQSQKMESIGRLAGGIAHDFNNILTALLGSAYFLTNDIKDGYPKMEDVEEIVKASHRAAELTRQLLAFSRRQVLEPKILSINALVENMEKMLCRVIGEDMQLATVLDPSISTVKADPGQLEQVLLNLVVNARDAMPNGGKLTIETANRELDEAYAAQHPGVIAGLHVMLAVSDTGVGMDAATKGRIFEPFFTTKEVGKGTGLGLSTVYGIVKQSGGHIMFYSELGRGTTFKSYFPVAREAPAQSVPASSTRSLAGTETILIVEDEDAVRKVAVRGLRMLGYKLIEATNAQEAEALASEHSAAIALVLTDFVMPGVDGFELSKKLAPILPNARFILMSGYTDRAALRQDVFKPGTPYIQKPFTLDSLAQKVREVLDGPRRPV